MGNIRNMIGYVGKAAKFGCNSWSNGSAVHAGIEGVNTYIKKMELFRGASNAIGKEEDVSLHPTHILAGELMTGSWSAHTCGD